MLGLPISVTAPILLVLLTPICLWVIFTDLKYMKIRNMASLVLLGLFAVGGLLLMPPEVWLWRWLNLVVVLVIGLVLNAVAHFGMGDVKFAAAAAPFFSASPGSIEIAMLLLAMLTIAAFLLHRLARAIPPIRRATPDWESWTRKDFPFGIVLAATLWGYYALLCLFA